MSNARDLPPLDARPIYPSSSQLLNAGARLETIQYLLGHEYLRTTQVYARVYDETVARDFYQALAAVEERVALEAATAVPDFTPWPRLLALLDQVVLARGDPARQEVDVAKMCEWVILVASGPQLLRAEAAYTRRSPPSETCP
jgi:hypothetical protein